MTVADGWQLFLCSMALGLVFSIVMHLIGAATVGAMKWLSGI